MDPQNHMDVDSDDDEVIEEIDVHVSTALSDQLALLQFPLRPNWKPYEPQSVSQVFMKEKSHQIMMKIQRNTTPAYYSKENDPLERLTGGGGSIMDVEDDEAEAPALEHGEKLVLTSSFLPLHPEYAIGYLLHGELHLTPLLPAVDKMANPKPTGPTGGGVLQMRPDFSFIDEALETQKKEEEKANERAKKREAELSAQISFAVGGTTQETPSRNKSASAKRRAMEKEAKDLERKEETWELMKHTFLDEGSLHGNSRGQLMNMLLSTQTDTLPFDVEKEEYMKMLNSKNGVVAAPTPSPSPSSAPNNKQAFTFHCVLCNGCIPHSEIRGKKECPLLRCQSAQLCGNCNRPFVSCPCPKPKPSSEEGLSMLKLKELTVNQQLPLLLMTKQVAHTQELIELTHSKKEIVIPLLQDVGFVVQGCWVIKSELCCNSAFEAAARNLLLLWLHIRGSVSKAEWMKKTKISPENAQKLLDKLAVLDKSTRTWSLRLKEDPLLKAEYPEIVENFSKNWYAAKSRIESFTEIEQPSPRSAQKSSKGRRSTSSTSVSSSSSSSSSSSPSPSSSRKMDTFAVPTTPTKTTITAGNTTPTTTSGTKNTTQSVTPLQEFLVEILKNNGACSYSFLRDQLDKREREGGGKVPAEKEILEALEGVAKEVRQSYVLASIGNPTIDKFRAVVLQLYKTNLKVSRAEIFKKTKEELGADFPLDLFSTIMEDLAYRKGKFWFFKSQ